MHTFTVVICGRPNVGKSTLFNRLSGKKKAITYPVAGTTRDVLEAEGEWRGKRFLLLDTGGIETKTKEEKKLAAEIQFQIDLTLRRADLILFLVDGKLGLDPNDFLIASKIKKLKKPVILVVNKIDSKAQEENIFQFYKLGFKDPFPLSSQTGKGSGDLLDKIVSYIKEEAKPEEEIKKAIRVGIFGRQNVGKSSLLNALLGKTKVLVSEMPGTTRDAIDTLIQHQDKKIILVDTAGIKKKAKVRLGVEKFSIKKSLLMIEKCDVALLVLNAAEGVTRQDRRISEQILKNKKGTILVINKWDLVNKTFDEKRMEKYIDYLQKNLSFFSFAPVVFVSAEFGLNIKKILDLILRVNLERNRILLKDELLDFYQSVILKRLPKMKKKERLQIIKIKDFLQEKTSPPKFSFRIGPREKIPPYYFDFLEKELRKRFGFYGTPLEIVIRNSSTRQS